MSNRTILCTVGTSIAAGCPALPGYHRRESEWSEDTAELDSQIADRLDAMNLTSEEDRVRASAEIHSLHRLDLQPDDEVVLLATDTADGRACAAVLREVIGTSFGIRPPSVHRIEGLQVKDGKRFRKEGLPHLIDALLSYLRDPQRRFGGGVILNPTGGFKGVVPFLTVMGMLHGAPVVYVFERSSELITLPPLPVTIDPGIYDRVRAALRWAHEEGVFLPAKFRALVAGFEPGEEPLFDSFLDFDGTDATLSALALSLFEDEPDSGQPLLLSREVVEYLDKLDADDRGRVESYAARLAGPLGRRLQRKRFLGTDLEVYGRSRYPVRFAGFVRDGRFHLCLARAVKEHDHYEQEFAAHQRADFEDRTDFVEWTPPRPDTGGESTEAESPLAYDDLAAEAARLRRQLDIEESARRSEHRGRREAEQRWEKASERVRKLTRENERLAQSNRDLSDFRNKLRERVQKLERQLAELRDE